MKFFLFPQFSFAFTFSVSFKPIKSPTTSSIVASFKIIIYTTCRQQFVCWLILYLLIRMLGCKMLRLLANQVIQIVSMRKGGDVFSKAKRAKYSSHKTHTVGYNYQLRETTTTITTTLFKLKFNLIICREWGVDNTS